MTIATEETRVRRLLERVETLEEVADSLDPDDQRRVRLLELTHADLADGDPVRTVIVAKLLGISEKSVRAWVDAGVLRAASEEPRLVLDLESVHTVMHLLRELRAAGQDRQLLEAVWHRLADQSMLDDPDLAESIDQMRQGRGRVLRPRPD